MSDAPPPRPRRSWVPIALAVLGALLLVAAAAVGGSAYWVSRHIHSQESSSADAAATLAAARARFAGQPPAVSLEDGRPVVTREPVPGGPTPIGTLHVLAFDADTERLVRVEIPGWALRLMGRGDVQVRDVNGLELPGRIRLQDIERRGPGLVLDTTTPDGSQVLIWTD